MTAKRTRTGGIRAFTLVELTIVMVVVGVVFAIAAPRMSRASANRRVDMAMDRIELDIRLAEQDAWHTGKTREIVFDVANSKYEIVGMTDASGNPYIVDLSAEPYNLSLVSADFGGLEKLVIDGRGPVAVAGNVQLSDGVRTLASSVELRDSDTMTMPVSVKDTPVDELLDAVLSVAEADSKDDDDK